MKTKPLFKEINNRVKQRYFNLYKTGYYLKPCIFDNCTVYNLCKDLNPASNCNAQRRLYAEMNYFTALMLKEYFGFIIKSETKYFGKGNPVESYSIRIWQN